MHTQGPHDPVDRRSGRLDVIRTILQAAQTILLLLRMWGDY